jgi:release factor glutamine methyltransferase
MLSSKTYSAALDDGTDILRNARIESAALDARVLLEHITGAREVSPRAYEKYMAAIARRAEHEPVAYITGEKEFWKYRFKVAPATLIPRPDSETLIEAVLAECETPHMLLDLGTGTGCLLLGLLGEYPNAHGVGIDSSRVAVAIARSNARALGFSNRAKFVNKSWRDAVPPKGEFDLIISNPPYIRAADLETLVPDVAKYEPKLALYGGADGLECYREIAAALTRWNILTSTAKILLEIGRGQSASVKKIFAATGFKFLKSFRDLAGIIRVLEFSK